MWLYSYFFVHDAQSSVHDDLQLCIDRIAFHKGIE
jgi:hypothetical protein